MSGFNDIPIRQNGIDELIDASWFNTIRTKLIEAFGAGGYVLESDLQTINNGGTITVDPTAFKELIPIIGNGGSVNLSLTPFGFPHGFSPGKEVMLLGTSDTNPVNLVVNDAAGGFYAKQNIKIERGVMVLLVWSGELNRFVLASGAGSSVVGIHESLGTGNGIITDFNLGFAPITEDSFIVFRNGMLVPRAEYTFANPTVSFLVPPAAGQKINAWNLSTGNPSVVVTPSGTFTVRYHEITAPEAAAKELTLAATPSVPSNVILDIIGGSSQRYGVDFSVSGNVLTWDSLGLDGVINVGDILRYWFFS